MDGFAEYDCYDGIGLAELVRHKQVQPQELVEEAIKRIEGRNPQLNAVIHKMYDEARAAAAAPLPEGPFTGVPFLLKDLGTDYAGVPSRNGCRFFKEWVPQEDSEIVRRFKAAGLIVVGKTNTPELGLAHVTEPELFGPTNNPWNVSRTPSGSSGGSAAAVAARIVPIAHGSDGGGSIRTPASCCGVFGLKPTRGRNPRELDVESWQGLPCQHVLTRSVRDSAAILDATAGPEAGIPSTPPAPRQPFLQEVTTEPGRLRIAFSAKPLLGDKVDDVCQRALDGTVALLEELGHDLIADAPDIDGPTTAMAILTMLAAEVRTEIEEAQVLLGRQAARTEFETFTWAFRILGGHLSAADLGAAIRHFQRVSRRMNLFLEDYDVYLTPTLAQPPVETGTVTPQGAAVTILDILNRLGSGWLLVAAGLMGKAAADMFRFAPYTMPFNISGQPAMSVPLYWTDDGLPIGSHFVGRYADEATLFRLAGQLERARPWDDRLPPAVRV